MCVCVCVRVSARVSLSESLVSPTLSLVMKQQTSVRQRTAWRVFDHEFFFEVLFRVSNPSAFEERASLSLSVCPVTPALLRAFCVVSRRNITRGIYNTRVQVCVCLVCSFLCIKRRERIIERVVIASLFCCLTGKTSRER